MKILMLGRWLPPPRRPVRGTREYQFARHLARRHQLTLAFIADHRDAAGPVTVLRSEFGDLEFAAIPRGWKSLASAVRLAAGQSCTMSYYRSEALRTRLAERVNRTGYGLVFVSSSSMIQYALDVSPTIPMVMDFAELDSEWWMRQARGGSFPAEGFFRAEATRLRAAETAAARRAALCLTETSEAAEMVRALGGSAPVGVIPTGIDVDTRGPAGAGDQPPTVVVSILFRSGPELKDALEFYRSVGPAVRAEVPRVRFVVASRDPVPAGRVRKDAVGIEVTALTDPRPLLHTRTVAVAPPGAGFDLRASVLEPMAAGIPVIVSSRTCERLGAQSGRDVQVADTASEISRRLIELLESDTHRREIGSRGRSLVETGFSCDVVTARLDQLLAGVLKAPPGVEPAARPLPIAVVPGG